MKFIPKEYIPNGTHNVKNTEYNAKNPQASQINYEPEQKKYNWIYIQTHAFSTQRESTKK